MQITSTVQPGAGTAAHNAATARAAARAAQQEYGAFIDVSDTPTGATVDGPLAGVPFAVKDNIDCRGMVTTAGTPALTGNRTAQDAEVIAALRAAGAVPIGKTNLHELAFGITSNNGAFGPVRNPHDPTRSAGGSSGGSAVAVAVGAVPFALATDTGGSARIPAAHCGVVGYRPSAGRYSSRGIARLSSTRDTVGVIANSVADVRTVDGVLHASGVEGRAATDDVQLRGLRLGVPTTGFLDGVSAEVLSSFQASLDALRAAGVQLVDLPIGRVLDLDADCGFPIVLYEAPRQLGEYLSGLELPFGSLTFDDLVRTAGSPDVAAVLSRIQQAPMPDEVYEQALRTRDEMRRVYDEAFADADVVAFVYPTVPILPPPLGDDVETDLDGARVPVFGTSIRNASPATLVGAPAVSVPGRRSDAGLPIGFSVEALPGTDDLLLAVSALVEQVVRTGTGSGDTRS